MQEDGTQKKDAKQVLFKADFAVSWAQKEVVAPTTWVKNPLDTDQRCLFIIYVGSNANGPLHGHLTHPNWPNWTFLAIFDKC